MELPALVTADTPPAPGSTRLRATRHELFARVLARGLPVIEAAREAGYGYCHSSGCSLGRTGTMSLKQALEQLAFGPCHHMEEVLAHPEQVPHWQAIVAGRAVNWDEVFTGYRSQVDWPGAHVWRELAAAYPRAKVIHTVRPEEQWWKSFSDTIGALLASDSPMPAPPHIAAMMKVAAQIIGETFGGAVTNRDVALAAYRRRTDQVRAVIPPERLLGIRRCGGLGAAVSLSRRAGAGAAVPTRKLDG